MPDSISPESQVTRDSSPAPDLTPLATKIVVDASTELPKVQVELVSTDGRSRFHIDVENISPDDYKHVSDMLFASLTATTTQAYKAMGKAMIEAVKRCPTANPADLWVHLIYHQFRTRLQRTDQSWKRVSGDAFEYVIQEMYNPILRPQGIRIRKGKHADAVAMKLIENGIGSAKTDLVLESDISGKCTLFGVLHCKASIAERLNDDTPASTFLMKRGYWSGLATFDAKMFPPPHGDGIVRGELGATRTGDKRNYFEVAGQFSGCYSFNLRTPPSKGATPSGIRIYNLHLGGTQPDALVNDIVKARDIFLQH